MTILSDKDLSILTQVVYKQRFIDEPATDEQWDKLVSETLALAKAVMLVTDRYSKALEKVQQPFNGDEYAK